MRILGLLFCAVAVAAGPIQAQAQVCDPTTAPSNTSCLSFSCTNIGQTTIDADKANIIACLQVSSTNNALVWKALSTSSGNANVGRYQIACDGDNGNNCYELDTSNGDIVGQSHVFSTFANGKKSFTTAGMIPKGTQGVNGTYQMVCDASGTNNCYVVNTIDGTLTGQSAMFSTFANGGTSFTANISP